PHVLQLAVGQPLQRLLGEHPPPVCLGRGEVGRLVAQVQRYPQRRFLRGVRVEPNRHNQFHPATVPSDLCHHGGHPTRIFVGVAALSSTSMYTWSSSPSTGETCSTTRCEQIMRDVCAGMGAELREFNGADDHVHL